MVDRQLNKLEPKLKLIENKIDNFEFEPGDLPNLESQYKSLRRKISEYKDLKEMLLDIGTPKWWITEFDQNRLLRHHKVYVKEMRNRDILTKDECVLLKHFLEMRRQFLFKLHNIIQEINSTWQGIRNQKLTE